MSVFGFRYLVGGREIYAINETILYQNSMMSMYSYSFHIVNCELSPHFTFILTHKLRANIQQQPGNIQQKHSQLSQYLSYESYERIDKGSNE